MATLFPELMEKVAGMPRHIAEGGGGAYGRSVRAASDQGRAAAAKIRHFDDMDKESRHPDGRRKKGKKGVQWSNAERKIEANIEAGSDAKEFAKKRIDSTYVPKEKGARFQEAYKRKGKSQYKVGGGIASSASDVRTRFNKQKADLTKVPNKVFKTPDRTRPQAPKPWGFSRDQLAKAVGAAPAAPVLRPKGGQLGKGINPASRSARLSPSGKGGQLGKTQLGQSPFKSRSMRAAGHQAKGFGAKMLGIAKKLRKF